MNTFIIIIIIVFIIAFFLLIRKINKARFQRVMEELTNFAAEKGSTISEFDVWGTKRIGIDKIRKYLFFIQKEENSMSKIAIDINDVFQCKVVNVSRVVGSGKESQSVIDKILLSFEFRTKGKQDIYLEFYNNEKDGMEITDELQLAEKWAEKVCSLLNK